MWSENAERGVGEIIGHWLTGTGKKISESVEEPQSYSKMLGGEERPLVQGEQKKS